MALPERIARALTDRINARNLSLLPTIMAIAGEYAVSYATARSAVALLRKNGLVRCGRGKHGIEIVGNEVKAGPGDLTTRGRIAADIGRRTLAGEYPIGEALPKIAFIAAQLKASAQTIVAALRLLQTRKLVHKSGRRWIAGPPVTEISLGPLPRTVLVIVEQEQDWPRFFSWPHTALFGQRFAGEMQLRGVNVKVCLRNDASGSELPSGMKAIDSLIHGLGERYLGALVNLPPVENESLACDLRDLAARGKPVVIFDSSGSFAEMGRGQVMGSCLFFRLFMDEPTAVRCALQAFAERGHKRVGLPVFARNKSDWTLNRANLIEQIAAAETSLTIYRVDQIEPFWDLNFQDRMERVHYSVDYALGAIESTRVGRRHLVQTQRECLFSATPSLARLIQDEKVTAIVGLNERFAREYYYWLKAASIQVPHQISLIGFDNYPEALPYPVSTMDFGFAQLGYLAAHAIIGDTNIGADREGNLGGVCRLIDKGSLGPACG